MTSSTTLNMAAPVRVGDVLADKYEVTRILGEGGMGVVVAARHRELDKLVALKFMHEEIAKSSHALDRFLREARAAAQLTNEHVGRVLDVGRLDDGVPYIVMEYLEGRDLGDLLGQLGRLDVADVCEYVLQACEAMAEAHTNGIIHRDLKPQNLFLTTRQDGRPLVKVLDFGISKAQYNSGPTATNTMMGTPSHMSPEQMRSSRTVDPRADIWSLGVILYQLLSGVLPFEGETATETMIKVLHDPPRPLGHLRPELPPELVAAVDKCLEKDREKRFENVAELVHALTPFAPARARAAILMMERVKSASTTHTMGPDDGIVPRVAAAPTAVLRLEKTTLGTAVGESIEVQNARPSRRWLAVVPIALVAGIVLTIALARGGGDDPTVRDGAAATAPEPRDAGVDAPPDAGEAASALDAGASIDAPARDAAPPPDARPRPPVPRGFDAAPQTAPPVDAAPAWAPEPPRLEPDAGLEIPR